MSSVDVLSTASASLLATQQQISVVAQNVGNAQSSSYVQRTATTVPLSAGTDGITKVVVQRAVNVALQNALLTSTSNSGAASYTNSIYQQLENLTGSSSGTPLLTSSVQGLISAFQAYQSTPESQTAQSGVTAAASSLVQSIQEISGGIAAIQTQTQNDLTSEVSSLNTALVQVQQLNRNIVQLQSSGTDASNLEDQRDAVIAQIAKLVPVKQQQDSNGSISLYTPSGVSLTGSGGDSAANFSYDAATNTVYASDDVNKTALNGSFTSGTIGAGLNILRTDSAAVQSTDPDEAPLEKVRQQLNGLADLLYSAPPAAATGLQSAYDSASPTNTGELASGLFVFSATPPAGSNDDRDYIAVNPALLNGTATVKRSAAEPVLALLTGTTNSFSGGNLSLSKVSFTQIAEAIASDQSSRASSATDDHDTATTNLSTATQAYSNQTGVSVDQQLSKLVVLQNAYNASAKIISTINTLQQALFSSIQ